MKRKILIALVCITSLAANAKDYRNDSVGGYLQNRDDEALKDYIDLYITGLGRGIVTYDGILSTYGKGLLCIDDKTNLNGKDYLSLLDKIIDAKLANLPKGVTADQFKETSIAMTMSAALIGKFGCKE